MLSAEHVSRDFDLLDEYLSERGITMFAVPGNHEDYDLIETLSPRDDGWLEFRSHILLAPRGLRTEMGGRSVLWCGGAGSVDRTWRVSREARARESDPSAPGWWWPQEALTDADVAKASAGGHATVMVAHDAPERVRSIESRIIGNPMGFAWADLSYANESRSKLTAVVESVKPELLLHGHFHFAVDDRFTHADGDVTRVVGVSHEDSPRSSGILDLEDLTFTFLHDMPQR